MNKNLYCILYNQAKGAWVVVRESALSCGATRYSGCIPMLVRCAGAVLALHPALQAQVVAAPNAPPANRPTVETTANNTPLVQIAPPNSAGLSNNHYHTFNVDERGVVLNNAQDTVSTQLGGTVAGNPCLEAGSARVILNQVVDANPSLLAGFLEVAGQRADLILANPHGIVCNGGGFINTHRAVLTTGLPLLGANGRLEGFQVNGGPLVVGEKGLRATSLIFLDLIARSLQVNGPINVNGNLTVVTGANQVSYGVHDVRPLPDPAPTPTVGIDVAKLGGMYAFRIHLVGTEAGVGVHCQGRLSAHAGGFNFTPDGKLFHWKGDATVPPPPRKINPAPEDQTRPDQPGATLASQAGNILGVYQARIPKSLPGDTVCPVGGNLAFTQRGRIILDGQTTATGTLTMDALDTVTQTGGLIAGGEVLLNSAAGIYNTGTISSMTDLTLRAANLDSPGYLGAGLNAQGRPVNEGDITIRTGGDLVNTGQNAAGGAITFTGTALSMPRAQIQAGTDLTLTATTGALDLEEATVKTFGPAHLTAAGALVNTGGQIAADQVQLEATSLDNRRGTIAQVGPGETRLEVKGPLLNQGGSIVSKGEEVHLGAFSLVNGSQGQIVHSGTGRLSIMAGAVNNDAGLVLSKGILAVTATQDLSNVKGTLHGQTFLKARGHNLINEGGQIVSLDGGMSVIAKAELHNAPGTTAQGFDGGLISAKGNAVLSAHLLKTSGTILGGTGLSVQAKTLENQGTLSSEGRLEVRAAAMTNAQGHLAAPAVVLTVPVLDNSKGQVLAQSLTIDTTNLTNAGGELTHLGEGPMSLKVAGALVNTGGGQIRTHSPELRLTPKMLDNTHGTIAHAGTGTLSITTGKGQGALVNSRGTVASNGLLTLAAASIDNQGGVLASQKQLEATAFLGDLDNRKADGKVGFIGGAQVRLTAVKGALLNQGGVIEGHQGLTIHARQLDNQSGSVANLGEAPLAIFTREKVDNTQGFIGGRGDTKVHACHLEQDQGTLRAGTDLLVQAATIHNTGTLGAAKDLRIRAHQTLDNHGILLAGTAMDVEALALDNQKGLIIAPALALKVAKVDNRQGEIISTALTVTANALDNAGGKLTQLGETPMVLAVAEALTNTADGLIQTRGADLRIVTRKLDNEGGTIGHLGGGTLSLRRGDGQDSAPLHGPGDEGTLVNTGGRIASLGQLDLATGSVANQGGDLVAEQKVKVVATSGGIDNAAVQDRSGRIGAKEVHLKAGQGALGNQGGLIEGSHGVDVTAHSVDNAGGNLTNTGQAPLTVTSTEALGNAKGTLGSNGEANLSATSIDNAEGTLQGGDNLTVTAANTLDNRGGTVHANQNLVVTAASAVNVEGQFSATGDVRLTVPVVDNAGGKIASGGDLNLETNTMPGDGQIHGGRDAAYQFQGDYTHPAGKALSANRDLTLATTGTLTTLGSLKAPGVVKVEAIDLHVGAEALIHGKTIQAKATQELVSEGRILGHEVTVEGGTGIQHSGNLVAGNNATLTSGGAIRNPGTLSAQNHLVLNAAEVHSQGRLGAGIDDQGRAVLPGSLKVTTTGPITATGDNTAGGGLTFTGANLVMAGAKTNADNITLTAGDLNHQGGTLQAKSEFNATLTGALSNDKGIIAAQQVRASAASVTNQGGSIAHTGETESSLVSRGALDNRAGTILNAKGTAKVLADGDLRNDQGTLQAYGNLEVKGMGIANPGGQILSTHGGMVVTAKADLRNGAGPAASGAKGGVIQAKVDVDLRVDALDNAGTIAGGCDLLIGARTVVNALSDLAYAEASAEGQTRPHGSATLSAGRHLTIKDAVEVHSLGDLRAGLNAEGKALAPGDLRITTTGPLVATGENLAGSEIILQGDTINLAGAKTEAGSTISFTATSADPGDPEVARLQMLSAQTRAGGSITLKTEGGTIQHKSGKLTANGALTVAAPKGAFANNLGEVAAAQVTVTSASMANQGGTITQSGEEKTHLESAGPLDNTGGTIRTNATDLFIKASAFDNTQKGRVQQAGKGELTLETGHLNNGGGDLDSNAQKATFTTTSMNNEAGLLSTRGTVTLSATGEVLNLKGAILAGEALTLKHAGVVNDAGRIEAKQVTMDVANLSNRSGAIVQRGHDKTSIRSYGILDNTAGTIRTAATDLTLGGSEFRNGDMGEVQHEGRGLLELTSGLLGNQGGTVATEGRAEVKATRLDNRSGILNAKGTAIVIATEGVDNAHGVLQAGGEVTLGGREIGNGGGRIVSLRGDLTVTTPGHLDNLAGTTVANTPGGVIGAGAKTHLHVNSLANTGTILGGQDLTLEAKGLVSNPGTLDAQGTLSITTQGKFSHTGTAIARQNLAVSAAEIHSVGKLGAGIDDQDQAVGAASLTLTATTGTLTAAGKQIAGGDLSFTGSELNFNHPSQAKVSSHAGGNVTLTARSGSINHGGATLQAKGTLTAKAPFGTLDNRAGTLQAEQVTVTAAGLQNQDGLLTQSGSGKTALTLTGHLDNTQGKIRSNAQDFDLSSASLDNLQKGELHHTGAGRLTLTTGRLQNNTGSLVSHGPATLTATGLDNVDGTFSTKGAASVTATEDVNNTRGLLQAGGDFTLKGRGVINDSGRVLANGGFLDLTATSQVQNLAGLQAPGVPGGVISATGKVDLRAVNLRNTGTLAGPGALTLKVDRHLDNSDGEVKAFALDLTTTTLTNKSGKVVQFGDGPTTLKVTELLLNTASGRIETRSADLLLEPQYLNNTDGTIAHAGAGTLTAKAGKDYSVFTNTRGRIETNGALNLTGSSVDNQGGAFAALGKGTVTATRGPINNQAIDGKAGFIGAQSLSLTANQGTLSNRGSRIEGRDGVNLRVRALDNADGTVTNTGEAALTVHAAQGVHNQKGTLAGKGQVGVEAGSIDNTSGTMFGGSRLKVVSKGDLLNPAGVLQATGSLEASAQQALINTGARMEAGGAGGSDSTLTISATTVENNSGRIANAGHGLTQVKATRHLTNSNPGGDNGKGLIGGAGRVEVHAPSLFNRTGGHVMATHDLALHTTQRLENTDSKLYAGRDLTLHGGYTAVTNTHGQIASGQDLSLEAGTVAKGGTIHGGRHASLSLLKGDLTLTPGDRLITAQENLAWTTTGTLINQGVLDAPGDLTLRAASLTNEASGVISGQKATRVHTSGALNNAGAIFGQDIALGASQVYNQAQAIVAARNSLHVGGSVVNLPGSSLQSEGELNIGGSLDANHKATGRAEQILNHGAEIRSGSGAMKLQAHTIINSNSNFTVAQASLPPIDIVEYMPKGRWDRYDRSQLIPTTGLDGVGACWLGPTGQMVPKQPTSREEYNAMRGAPLAAHPLVPEMWQFDDYTEYIFKRTVTKTIATSSQPGEILSGGNMTLSADTIINDKSRIIAANALDTAAVKVRNLPYLGQIVTRDTGTSQYWDTEWRRTWRKRRGHELQPYNSPLRIDPLEVELGVARDHAPVSAKALRSGPALTAGPQVSALGLSQHSATPLPDATAQAGVAASGGAASDAARTSQPQTVGHASTSIPDLSLLGSRLYKENVSRNGSCLFETDSRFLGKAHFPGLEKMLAGLNLDCGSRRLGDGYLETQLVAKQVHELTGRMFLIPESTQANQDFVTLMEQGLAAAKALNLEPGVMPTEAQLRALTQDCVWMVKQKVARVDGTTEEVLVPVVLLSQTRAADLKPTGALIAARTITGALTGSLENAGTLMAETQLRFTANTISNTGDLRTTGADSDLDLFAQHTLTSEGSIRGHRVVLEAGDHLALRTTTMHTEASSGSRTAVYQLARVDADSLFVMAGRDLSLDAARIRTTQDAAFAAGRNLTLSTVATEDHEHLGSGQNHINQSRTGTANTQIQSGGSATFESGKDFTATAPNVRAEKALKVDAKGSLILTTAAQTSHLDEAHHQTQSGFLSSSSVTSQLVRDASFAQGSTFSGGTVDMTARESITIEGSAVVGEDDVNLKAKGPILITAATHTESTSGFHHERHSGLGSAGAVGFSVGTQEQKHQFDHSQETQHDARSQVVSIRANVAIGTAGDLTSIGSDVGAAGSVDLNGRDVNLFAGCNQSRSHEIHETKQTGLTVALRSTALEAVQGVTALAGAAVDSRGDDRMRAANAVLGAAKARELALQAEQTQKALANGTQGATAAVGLKVSASYGSSQSRAEFSSGSLSHSGSKVVAGAKLNIHATRDGNGVGAELSGETINLEADRDLNLESVEDTSEARSSNTSSSSSIGASYGFGEGGAGFSVDVAASRAKGRSNGNTTTHRNTTVSADGQVTLKSGHNSTLRGAQVSGKGITADVGNNLTLASRQNEATSQSRQESAGFSASIGAGGSASAHQNQSRTDGTFASVNDMTGLYAGENGFQVNVQQHTDTKGAGMFTTGPVEASKLSTTTLSSSHIENHSEGSSSTSGYSISTAMATNGYQAAKGIAGNLASQANEDGSDASTTHSVIQGQIAINDEAAQQARTGQGAAATIAGVSHNPEGAHRALVSPDLAGMAARTQAQQELNTLLFQAATACSEVAHDASKEKGVTMSSVAGTPDGTSTDRSGAKQTVMEGTSPKRLDPRSGPESGGERVACSSDPTDPAMANHPDPNDAAASAALAAASASRFGKLQLVIPPSHELNLNPADYTPRTLKRFNQFYTDQAAAGHGLHSQAEEVLHRAYITLPNGDRQPVVMVADAKGVVKAAWGGIKGVPGAAVDLLIHNPITQGFLQVNDVVNAGLNCALDTDFPIQSDLGKKAEAGASAQEMAVEALKGPVEVMAGVTAGVVAGKVVGAVAPKVEKVIEALGKAKPAVGPKPSLVAPEMPPVAPGASAAAPKVRTMAPDTTTVTSEGAATSATYGPLKSQLYNENLINISNADLRLAQAVKGSGSANPNFSIGKAAANEADKLGRVWVGDGARQIANGWVSADGTLVYRSPALKHPTGNHAGSIKANFERYTISPVSGEKTLVSNGHLDIK